MTFTKLNENWNADPNAPEPSVNVTEGEVTLQFYLNSFLFDDYNEGDIGYLVFKGCSKYSFNTMNDEGYYSGRYRYNDKQLPWGEFYELQTNSENDFPKTAEIISDCHFDSGLKHFLFFMRDNTFECLAKSWEFRVERAGV